LKKPNIAAPTGNLSDEGIGDTCRPGALEEAERMVTAGLKVGSPFCLVPPVP
jgi:hypothetical protein